MNDDFEEIVARHYESLFKFAISLTRDEADACDLTQHTFQVWATKGHQLRDPSRKKTWLFTTLYRAFLQSRRSRLRHSHHSLDEVPPAELPAVSPDFANQADSSQVLAALAKVEQVYQSAVALFYLEDYSYNEIAKILAVPLGTVKSRIARGLVQLRKIIGTAESNTPSSGLIAPVNQEQPAAVA